MMRVSDTSCRASTQVIHSAELDSVVVPVTFGIDPFALRGR